MMKTNKISNDTKLQTATLRMKLWKWTSDYSVRSPVLHFRDSLKCYYLFMYLFIYVFIYLFIYPLSVTTCGWSYDVLTVSEYNPSKIKTLD
jgi:hypothetical protein